MKQKFRGTGDDCLSLLKAMLMFDPSKRITVEDALRHPFLSEEQSDEKERNAVCRHPMSADIESVTEQEMDRLIDHVSCRYYIIHNFVISILF